MKSIKFLLFALMLISQAIAQNGAWYQLSDAPTTYIRRGCAITWGGFDTLYALRGSNQTTFYGYIVSKDSWITRASLPASVDTGGAIVNVQSCSLFAIRGKNSRAFYLYRPNQWFVRDSAPEGFHIGASLCWAGGDTIYATKGNNTNKFFKYSISQNTWRAWVAADTIPEQAQEGSGMCWTGDNYIFGIFGSSNRFYRYNIVNRTWTRVHDAAYWRQGASLVWDGGTKIYAVLGGGAETLLVYNIPSDEWITTIITPEGIGGKAEGAGLLAWDNRSSQKQLYLLRGAGQNDFYRFCLPLVSSHSLQEGFDIKQFPPPGWQAKSEEINRNWKDTTAGSFSYPPPTSPGVAEYDPINSTTRKEASLITPKFYLGRRPALTKIQFYIYNSAPDYPGNDTLLIEYYKIAENKFYRVATFRRFDTLVSQGWVRREVLFVCQETDTMLISFHGISRDQYSIYIDSVAITIDTAGLYSTTPLATASNQSHLLARKPEHQRLHTVFRSAILDTTGAPTGKAFLYYTWSDDYGTYWANPYMIDTTLSDDLSTDAGEPASRSSISTGVFNGKEPWIVYVRHTGRICTAIQRQNGTWKKIFNLHPANNVRSVSMAMGLSQGIGRSLDLAYVVMRNSTLNELNDSIYFFAFDTTGQRYADAVMATGEILYEPSIAITPTDYIHIAYMGYAPGFCIYYRTTPPGYPTNNYLTRIQPITWSDTFRVSLCPGYPTEIASRPSVEAYGAFVYVAWQGGAPAEVWRRKRDVSQPVDEWYNPQNMSQSANVSSRHPVMSTSEVTAFEEVVSSQNREVYANFWDNYIMNISQTNSSSRFPHIDAEVPEEHARPPYALPVNTIWTERLADSVYEVRFLRYIYPAEKQLEYYTIETGDSIQSPMCLSRDGFIRYPELPIDFGNQTVKYELPYLHPCYHHKIKAVVYQRVCNRLRQNFTIDSIPLGSIEYEPNVAETIEIEIPKETYQIDSRAILEITKNQGQFVTLANPLIVYQYEVPETTSSNNSSQSAGKITILTKPKLYQNYPNPFKTQTTIHYSLPSESKVYLSVFDISGRLVNTLVNQQQSSGIYSVNWNGIDNHGRIVSSGVYFYRLKTDNYQTTNRAIIIR